MGIKKNVKDQPIILYLYVFRYFFRNQLQGIMSGGPILIIDSKMENAKKQVKKEDNQLAEENDAGTGYKCVQIIFVSEPINLSLILE